MGLINNKNIYPEDEDISVEDSVIGSDSDENGVTKNYSIGEVYDFINYLNNKKSASYIYSETDSEAKEGAFNISGYVFKFNEKDLRGIDNSLFFRELKNNKKHVRLSLSSNANIFSYFKIDNVVQELNTFSLELIPIGTTSVSSFAFDEKYSLSTSVIEESIGPIDIPNRNQSDWNQADDTRFDFIKNKPRTISSSQANAIALNTAKIGLNSSQVNILSKTSGTNTGDQDISGISKNASDISFLNNSQNAQDVLISLNTSKVSASGSVTSHSDVIGAGSGEIISVAERNKLASLESSKFLGEYTSVAQLESAHNNPPIGSYAYVDEGVGNNSVTYIWDSTDSKFIKQKSTSTAETPASIHTKYGSNPNTNHFTDAKENKLAGIENSAEVNRINTASNGLSLIGKNVELGGTLTKNTVISIDNKSFEIRGDAPINLTSRVGVTLEANTYISKALEVDGTITAKSVDEDLTANRVVVLDANDKLKSVPKSSLSPDLSNYVTKDGIENITGKKTWNVNELQAIQVIKTGLNSGINIDNLGPGHGLTTDNRLDGNGLYQWNRGSGANQKVLSIFGSTGDAYVLTREETASGTPTEVFKIDNVGNLTAQEITAEVINEDLTATKMLVADNKGKVGYKNQTSITDGYLPLDGSKKMTGALTIEKSNAGSVGGLLKLINSADSNTVGHKNAIEFISGASMNDGVRVLSDPVNSYGNDNDLKFQVQKNGGGWITNVTIRHSGELFVGSNEVYHEGNKQKGFDVRSSAPNLPSEGDAYYDSSLKKARCWNGSTWNNLF